MTNERKIERIDSQTQPEEPDSKELRGLTLEEMSMIGGGVIQHAPVPDSRTGKV
jgi:hypothetical protein